MAKRIGSVLELAKGLGEDKSFVEDFATHLNKRRLVHALTAMRAAKGLTQAELATKMGCTQSRVSKIEASDDLELNFRSIVDYAQSLDVRLEISFVSKHATLTDRVKHHAFCIKRLMDSLVRLAVGDAKIAQGVSHFFGEAAFNLMNMLQDSVSKLPEECTPMISVNTCGVDDLDEDYESGKQTPQLALSH